MVNMDYPGPCFSCSAIEGCASEESKALATRWYCKGIQGELNAWKATLYDVTMSFMDIRDDEREKLIDAVAEIKALVREIEAKTAQLEAECPMEVTDHHIGVRHEKAMEVIGAGSFGG